MRPLSLAERRVEEPTISLSRLLTGSADIGGTTEIGLATYIEEIVASGFPDIRTDAPRARALRLDGYLDAVVQREFAEQGLQVRRPQVQLADPALAARLLGVDAAGLSSGAQGRAADLRRGTLLGALFEHLVTLSVRTYAAPADASVHHLRTGDGDHEVDLIVQRPDGRVLAMEVKLADRVTDDDVRHLVWLRSQIGDELVDAVVVTTGRHAYRRSDGIAVVPAALLGS